MPERSLKVMVLAGGPDREHDVSLLSGETVAGALAQAGHDVRQCDIGPDDLGALDAFADWGGEVVFPMLHGAWGEGGPLQRILDQRGLCYVGCGPAAAELCMDKYRAKLSLAERGLPTPPFELLRHGQRRTLEPPAVLKPPREGSSIDLCICRSTEQVRRARSRLHRRHPELLIEKFVEGKELTIGILGETGSLRTLPPIHIVPATEFYDYQAKYERDDTRYLFDIDLPATVLDEARRVALETARALGCRHLSRVDLIADADGRPWVLEVNTIPGFTSHSLLPKAAAHAGIALPTLVDQLVRMALNDTRSAGRVEPGALKQVS